MHPPEKMDIKRLSWLDFLQEINGITPDLTPRQREVLSMLDQELFEIWNLGENLLAVWTRTGNIYRFLAARHYVILETFDSSMRLPMTASDRDLFVNRVLANPKQVDPGEFENYCSVLGTKAQVLKHEFADSDQPEPELVTPLVARYGVALVRQRAVVLIDVVGFSMKSPLEQVAIQNSLSYSVNSAYQQLLSKGIHINFARTTTGDGFYIWNREQCKKANIDLYKLLMLLLADNAVAQRKAVLFPVPRLRAAFHVGEHYEFHQVEALNPTTYSYIVGQVTVDLARLIEKALPGQIMLGDFRIMDEASSETWNTALFVETAGTQLNELKGLVVAGDLIEKVHCYLTGEQEKSGGFCISQYRIVDKHGTIRTVYNAKINIHLAKVDPIYLGLQSRELKPADASIPSGPQG